MLPGLLRDFFTMEHALRFTNFPHFFLSMTLGEEEGALGSGVDMDSRYPWIWIHTSWLICYLTLFTFQMQLLPISDDLHLLLWQNIAVSRPTTGSSYSTRSSNNSDITISQVPISIFWYLLFSIIIFLLYSLNLMILKHFSEKWSTGSLLMISW